MIKEESLCGMFAPETIFWGLLLKAKSNSALVLHETSDAGEGQGYSPTSHCLLSGETCFPFQSFGTGSPCVGFTSSFVIARERVSDASCLALDCYSAGWLLVWSCLTPSAACPTLLILCLPLSLYLYTFPSLPLPSISILCLAEPQ